MGRADSTLLRIMPQANAFVARTFSWVRDLNVEPSESVAEPRPAGSDHGPAGPPKVMKTPRGARTPACRVHTHVNAWVPPRRRCLQLRIHAGAGAFACEPVDMGFTPAPGSNSQSLRQPPPCS